MRLLSGLFGGMLILGGLSVLLDPVYYHQSYRVAIDLSDVKVPYSFFSIAIGAYIIYLVFSPKKSAITKFANNVKKCTIRMMMQKLRVANGVITILKTLMDFIKWKSNHYALWNLSFHPLLDFYIWHGNVQRCQSHYA